VSRNPCSLDHTSASATPLSALTDWQALFDHARLAPGQRVLIHGATRGVGSFAVPLARWRGAHVIGTASARNGDFVVAGEDGGMSGACRRDARDPA
jgi:NADPH:quinone reductase-like Zn-dependent oxidoreductase